MIGDAGVSLGVVVTGAIIIFTDWNWLDPVISILIALIIVFASWELLQDSLNLIIDMVPKNVNPVEVKNYLINLPDVEEVHDLHIWAMSTTENALTVHLVMPKKTNNDSFLKRVSNELLVKFGIHHSTVQIEQNAFDEFCRQKHPDAL